MKKKINEEKENKLPKFKKFSEISGGKKLKEESIDPIETEDDDDRPAFPNLPKSSGKTPKRMKTDYMMPSGQNPNEEDDNKSRENVKKSLSAGDDVKFYGKIAQLPKGTKASKGYSFLENVKVSKSSIWYIMVEKQDNELQMVKYNHKKGVDLSKFVSELKEYYKSKFAGNGKVQQLIEAIHIDGNDKYSRICNIPMIQIEGKKVISKITEDLIKLLSK
jgi:hypothetical protein